jgi:hypothetical protein
VVWFMGFDDAADGSFGVYFCHVVCLTANGECLHFTKRRILITFCEYLRKCRSFSFLWKI